MTSLNHTRVINFPTMSQVALRARGIAPTLTLQGRCDNDCAVAR